ncbi:MAG: hypothetical protein M3O85_01490 [Acidobacteriota bacterium]|nr:hypothetical protein [Acidobacteriota bacterium]
MTALFGVCAAVLALLLYWQAGALREERRQVQDLRARLESASKAANLDAQEKCAKQAHEVFKSFGWDKEQFAALSNHYNPRLGRCFVRFDNTDAKTAPGTIWDNTTVLDAFEEKPYAQYMWHTEKDKKYWEVAPFMCKVTIPSGEEKICHSSEEFDALVKYYME